MVYFPMFYNTLQLNFRQSKFTMVFQDMLIDFILLGSQFTAVNRREQCFMTRSSILFLIAFPFSN